MNKSQILVFEDGHIVLAVDGEVPESVKQKVREVVKEWRDAPGQDYPMLVMTNAELQIVKGLPKVEIV